MTATPVQGSPKRTYVLRRASDIPMRLAWMRRIGSNYSGTATGQFDPVELTA